MTTSTRKTTTTNPTIATIENVPGNIALVRRPIIVFLACLIPFTITLATTTAEAATVAVTAASYNDSSSSSSSSWENRKWSHALTPMSGAGLSRVAALNDETMMKAFLDGILVPRIPGTRGHERVKAFIVGIMEVRER